MRNDVISSLMPRHFAYGVFAAVALTACSDEQKQRTPPPPVPVRVTEAQRTDFDLHLKSLGTITALNSVIVRSRIDGELVEVLFQEGQSVKQGQLLARIDPRQREVELAEAVGRQQESRVQLQNAEQELERLNGLLTTNFVSKQMVTNQEAQVRQYRARLATTDAAVANAKLQLEYTRIVAPIAGRVGLRRVDRGNLIRSGDTQGLVTITQMQPISAVFTIPETQVASVVDAHRSSKALVVEAWDREERQRLAVGQLAGLDNQIDTATGTLRLKATFANEDGRLFPNQFVNVRLHVRTIQNAIVVPGAAVQYGAKGTYVFVINDGKSTMREVALGAADNDRIVITKGLQGGEHIVLEGLERLRDGRKVQIVEANAEMEEGAAPAKRSRARGKGGEPAAKRNGKSAT